MPDSLERVKQLLAELSRADLLDARNFASMRLAVGVSQGKSAEDSFPLFVLDVLVDVMKSRGADVRGAASLRASVQFPAFRAKLVDEGVTDFLKHASESNKVKMRALVYLALSLLYDNLLEMNVAISSSAMMTHIHRLPSAMNLAFPGYAEAGLLRLVIREKEDANVRTK